jgi:hypothetical protein
MAPDQERRPGQGAMPETLSIRNAKTGGVAEAGRSPQPLSAPHPGRMELRGWQPVRRGTLLGFADTTLRIGLQIDDVAVLTTHDKAWTTLPARPVITADGRVAKLPGSSKTQYVAFLRWRDRAQNDAFSQRVVELVRAIDPGAFDDGTAP